MRYGGLHSGACWTGYSMSFVDDLLTAMRECGPGPHMRCVALLSRYAGCTVYLPTESKAARRHRAAAHMLESKMCSDEIANALRERFNISARQAWRDIATAKRRRQLSEK
jgi:hypothetical protein